MAVTMYQLLLGDCIEVLKTLDAGSVQTCVTSPPYYGLRDYQVEGQIGLEETPEMYVAKLVDVFREVRRVLRDDGTLWLNLGDSYFSPTKGDNRTPEQLWSTSSLTTSGGKMPKVANPASFNSAMRSKIKLSGDGLKPKDLIGIPWAVAKALQQPYYTGRIAKELDRVWLAATIDAEGSICGFTHTRKDNGDIRRGIHLTITNTNIRMLDEAYRIWKTSKQDHNFHGEGHLGSLDTYRWIAHGVEEKQQLLAEIYPYLICKKSQALLAWNFLEISKQARGRNKGAEGDENRSKSAWIVDALSKLNHFQSVDIPAWCKEPPSLHEQGYYLRSDIIWSKPNPMPESVRDRPTKAHEYIFLLSKSSSYFYDAEAIAEKATDCKPRPPKANRWEDEAFHDTKVGFAKGTKAYFTRNKRTVWSVSSKPYIGAHFATFPPDLIEPCILAGSKAGDTVLDPFNGSGTTGAVSLKHNRNYIGIELNPEYIELAHSRITQAQPLLLGVV